MKNPCVLSGESGSFASLRMTRKNGYDKKREDDKKREGDKKRKDDKKKTG